MGLNRLSKETEENIIFFRTDFKVLLFLLFIIFSHQAHADFAYRLKGKVTSYDKMNIVIKDGKKKIILRKKNMPKKLLKKLRFTGQKIKPTLVPRKIIQ